MMTLVVHNGRTKRNTTIKNVESISINGSELRVISEGRLTYFGCRDFQIVSLTHNWPQINSNNSTEKRTTE